MVQIRDVDTWIRLPGVTSGDLGPKFGYDSKDNGWARFDQVRIPRTNMLMGIAQVDKEGQISIEGDLRELYSIMMLIRMLIIKDTTFFTFAVVQMAMRYNVCRRQFST